MQKVKERSDQPGRGRVVVVCPAAGMGVGWISTLGFMASFLQLIG
jgi:hypothetical protein